MSLERNKKPVASFVFLFIFYFRFWVLLLARRDDLYRIFRDLSILARVFFAILPSNIELLPSIQLIYTINCCDKHTNMSCHHIANGVHLAPSIICDDNSNIKTNRKNQALADKTYTGIMLTDRKEDWNWRESEFGGSRKARDKAGRVLTPAHNAQWRTKRPQHHRNVSRIFYLLPST